MVELLISRGGIFWEAAAQSANGMIYTRGSSSDFDKYAKATEEPGWSWKNLQGYIKKNEKWLAPIDGHNATGQFDPSVHSITGVNAVSLAGFPQITNSRVLEVTEQSREEFPFNQDMNSGTLLGIGWVQFTINKGRRSSSATSYLSPEYVKRPNLDILVNTRVTRILPTVYVCSKPAFRMVEIVQKRTGVRRRLIASKEIILSAGAYGTPHILLSSGIGDASELKAVGVEPVHHISDVGKNLQEHPLVSSVWSINSNDTSIQYPRDPSFIAENLKQWTANHTGPLVLNGATHLIFSRLPNDSSILHLCGDPASGGNAPHFETILTMGLSMGSFTGHLAALVSIVASPTSRGNVTLKSSDPFVDPLINPGLLTSQFDKLTLREAVKTAMRFFAAPAWKDFVVGPLGGLADATTDKKLDKWIRQNAKAGDHPVGTAAMSPRNAKHGVVDPDLRLKNASGLRVVDASVLVSSELFDDL
ncbi:hypothetical protein H0H87_009808 [Tephrocybe sp. NHM501043]|nr:hypothetical protein H0H87_009808 [Tephrocybe sp. NHM501043]